MAKKMVLILVAVAMMASCASNPSVKMYPGARHYSPTHPDQVELLRHEPRRAHMRFGEIRLEAAPRWSRFEVERILREEAANIGADALVIVVDNLYRDSVVTGFYRPHVRSYRERIIIGVAIRFER